MQSNLDHESSIRSILYLNFGHLEYDLSKHLHVGNTLPKTPLLLSPFITSSSTIKLPLGSYRRARQNLLWRGRIKLCCVLFCVHIPLVMAAADIARVFVAEGRYVFVVDRRAPPTHEEYKNALPCWHILGALMYCLLLHCNDRNKLSVFEHSPGSAGQAEDQERSSINALKGLGLVKARSKVHCEDIWAMYGFVFL